MNTFLTITVLALHIRFAASSIFAPKRAAEGMGETLVKQPRWVYAYGFTVLLQYCLHLQNRRRPTTSSPMGEF
jgi:hypothetical protein